MRNPYIVGNVVYQPNFYGRRHLIADLLDERHRCVYLMGSRRVGKTSLLHCLEAQVQSPWIGLFLNLQTTRGDPAKIGEELTRQIKRKSRQVPGLRAVSFDRIRDVCDAVEALGETAEDKGFRVLLLWDEAEDLLMTGPDCLKRLRSVLQDSPAVRTILAATKGLSELNDLCSDWKTSPFLFGFDTRYISCLSQQEAVELICQTNNPEGHVRVGKALRKQIMDLTNCHPYLTQLLCDRLFQFSGKQGKLRSITDDNLVVDAGLADILQIDYDSLSYSERVVLRYLSEQGHATEDKLHASLLLKTDDLRSYLYGLKQLGYIRHKDGEYQVANHFLHTWLKMGHAKETPEAVSDEASLEVVGASPGRNAKEVHHRSGDLQPHEGFRYDAFISYSHKDKEWVRDTLLPRLECEGLRISIDHRDFAVGVPSLVNMEDAVKYSRKTLLILTPNWITSEWTKFEGLLIQTDDPSGHRRRILPLMVLACSLPDRLKIFTYLDMTNPAEFDSQARRLVNAIRSASS